jgi:hypothetical protein
VIFLLLVQCLLALRERRVGFVMPPMHFFGKGEIGKAWGLFFYWSYHHDCHEKFDFTRILETICERENDTHG